MGFNLPEYDEDNFSFGPGRLFLGAAGATPTVDVGAITEDGVTIQPENTTGDIMQGNPRQIVYSFNQQQGVTVEVSGMEWNFDNLAYALGAGQTTLSASEDVWEYGGQPITKQAAIHVQHQMAAAGHTLDAYIWKAVTNGNPSLPFTHDAHNFALAFKAQLSKTDWAGNALDSGQQLIKCVRTKT